MGMTLRNRVRAVLLVCAAASLGQGCLIWAQIADALRPGTGPGFPPIVGNPGFPSSGGPGGPGPEGSDPVSSSTNHSSKLADPESRANPFAGAAYIRPPQPNNYGAVSLSYPIEIPPGRAGVQPQLGLSYSSNGGDGWVGIGWSLGLGSISRTTDYGQLYYDHRDVFTFNGKRLVRVAGPPNSQDGTYRAEIESDFARLELSDSASGGVWRVFDTNGTVTTYGESSTSRIFRPDNSSATYSWYLARVEDRNGNYLSVEYDTSFYAENNVLYLKEIRYTGNSTAGFAARQYVRFFTRSRDDAYVSKAPGFLMKMDRLLERIEVGWDNGTLWDYRLTYTMSLDSLRPLLIAVSSSHETTRPRFHYQEAEHLFVWERVTNLFASEPETNPLHTEYFEGDFNGDGISDMVFFNPETGSWKAAEGRREGGYAFKTYGNRFQGHAGPAKIQFFKGNVTGDYNGDGRADIALYLPETREFWVALHDGRVFQWRSYGVLTAGMVDIFRTEWFPGDFDGNGLSDSLLFDEATGEWILIRNLGDRFEFTKFARVFQNLFRKDYNPDANRNSVSTADTSQFGEERASIAFLSGDYNGDGRSDLSFYDNRRGEWWVGENHRDDTLGFHIQWKLYKKFTAPEQTLFGYDRFSGDFNGDGLSDFLLFDKAQGQWILGETGNGTINFRVYSAVPQHRDITRWLQGDFNGDGRTDIGFYSDTDRNFWIGEATPDGFRYRIYNNMAGGPDPSVLARAPLPKDDVVPTNTRLYLPGTSSTADVDVAFDGNAHKDRGERVFVGCFTTADCAASPEVLIFDRTQQKLFLKRGLSAPDFVMDLSAGVTFVAGGRPVRGAGGNHELYYYRKTASAHEFFVIRHTTGTSVAAELFASFGDEPSKVANFSIKDSVYDIGSYDGSGNRQVLVLNDQGDGNWALVGGGALDPGHFERLNVSGSSSEFDTNQDFQNLLRAGTSGANRQVRPSFSAFSGEFTASGAKQLVLTDRRTSTHTYYLATRPLSGTVHFQKLSGNPTLSVGTFSGESPAGMRYHLRRSLGLDQVVYASQNGATLNLFRLSVNAGAVAQQLGTLSDTTFAGELDHNGDALVRQTGSPRRYLFGGGGVQPLAPPENYPSRKIERPDLYTKVYPYRWIQGDYNGDGKTDIGIIHLKDSVWYFANTRGTVPDLMHRVENGIGGTYTLEYENSTKFDNTSGDDIPDLPMNYKVCTRIHQDDGLGNRITLNYEYKNGYAFSAFLNGRKETDYFGFGEFTVRDAFGGKTISTYNNIPFADFRHNRALAGAIKETRFLGYDNQDYSRTTHEYQIHTIQTAPQASYLVTPAAVRKYVRGVQTETRTRNVTLAGYQLLSSVETTTDHHSAAAHTQLTVSERTQFETVSATNQQRPTTIVRFEGLAQQQTSAHVYDGRGNLIRKTTTGSGSGLASVPPAVMEYVYDTYGNRTEESNTSGSPARTARYSFDGELHQFRTEERRVGPSGDLVTGYTIDYGSAFGEVASMTDPNGNRSFTDYDGFGRLIRVRADTESGIQTLQDYTYSTSFPLSAKSEFHTGTPDPHVVMRTYHDGLGRAVHTVRTAANGRYARTGRIVYDAVGRVTQKGQSDWADASEIDTFRVNLAVRNPTITEYDSSGRVRKVTLPKAQGESGETSISTLYNDPWEVTTIHSGGTRKRTVKNARGHTLLVEDSGTGTGGSVTATVGFCFDATGNRLKKQDLNGSSLSCDPFHADVPGKDTSQNNTTYWAYDALGRLIARSDPDLGVDRYQHNAFGDVTQETDARGLVTTMAYDQLGRLTQKNLPGSEGTVHYAYDVQSGTENGRGRLVALNDSSQTKVLSYDRLGRLKREDRSIKDGGTPFTNTAVVGAVYTTDYTYDLLGRSYEILYPSTVVVNTRLRTCYRYNSFGYTQSVHVRPDASQGAGCGNGQPIILDTTYTEFGEVARVEYGNHVIANYTYDVKGRLSKILTTQNGQTTTKTIQNADYTFDVQNNITGVANNAEAYATASSYQYDGMNRLVDASGSYVEADDGTGTTQTNPSRYRRLYEYTPNGNLTAKEMRDPTTGTVTDRWQYTYANHMATRIDTIANGAARFTMGYDAAGNMTFQRDTKSGLEKEISYDSYNRIRLVTNPATSDTAGRYWYDDTGFRVRKIARILKGTEYQNVETLYPCKLYGLELADQIYPINNIYLNGLRVAAVASNGSAAWFLTDQVDSVKLVLDPQGEMMSRTEYLPYGEVFVQKGNKDFAPKYNSQELDKETNYYFYNARYYDPETSRFVTADSIVPEEFETQSWNRFAYVEGNPIRAKDPTGHRPTIAPSTPFYNKEFVHSPDFGGGAYPTQWQYSAKASMDSAKHGPGLGTRAVGLLKDGYNWVRKIGTRSKSRGSSSPVQTGARSGDAALAPRQISWVREPSIDLRTRAGKYQAGAEGYRHGQAPALTYKNPNPKGKSIVKFDGVAKDGTLVERKLSIGGKARDQAYRQGRALRENNRAGRWEVPNATEKRRAEAAIERAGMSKFIKVRVVPLR